MIYHKENGKTQSGNKLKKLNTLVISALTILSISANSHAGDVDHFKGKASPDLQSALCNLQKYDAVLKAMTSKPLTANDMAEIHQLTYTLEVAVQRVQAELAVAAEDLEKVHKSSETMGKDKVKQAAEKYLAVTEKLTQNLTCH